MSNTESFVDEVTEELQRDRLFAFFRKWGWIAILAVLALVAAASWSEWSKSKARSAAEARGDAVLEALDTTDPVARASALAKLDQPGPVGQLLQAGAKIEAGDEAGAAAALKALSTSDQDAIYRDLARFKLAILPETSTSDARAILDQLSTPGNPFRLLSMEQLALRDLADGDWPGAIERLKQISEDAEISNSLRDRVTTLLVALGAPLDEEGA